MFIPLETVNFFIYAMDNLVIPFKYYSHYDKTSLQAYFPNHILMSKSKWVQNCNLSVEVEILEKDLIKLDENFFLCSSPLTFSNIKNIWYQKEKQMKISTVNLEISTTKLPKQKIKVDTDLTDISIFEPDKYSKNLKHKSLNNKIKLFSKYLGAMAIAKKVLNIDLGFPKNGYFTNKKYREIEQLILKKDVDIQDIEKIALKEKVSLEKSIFGFYILEKIPKNSLTYILIILDKYRYKMSDNLKGLMIEISKLDDGLQKIFLLLYGLMLGYQNLPLLEIDTKLDFKNDNIYHILNQIEKRVFQEKIKKVDRLEQLKTDIFEKNFYELLEKFGVSETTLKPNIRQTILESDISISEKIKLFEKFNLRVPKSLRILKLKEILKNGKFTSKELAEKLKVSVNTIRNYLKDIPVEKIRDGKIINYFLK